MNTKKIKNYDGFTLVELIVVIAILAILGLIAFISLQGYQVDSRNSVRISDIKNISTSLEIYNIQTGKYPGPNDFIDITSGTSSILFQGNMGLDLLSVLGIHGGGLDPSTGNPYNYSTDSKRSKYELLYFFENSLELGANNLLTNKTYAADFNISKPQYSGKSIGTLLNTNNIPLNELVGGIDLNNLNSEYKIFYDSNGSYVSGTGKILATAYSLLLGIPSLDNSLIGYWDMQTKIKIGNSELFEDLSNNNNHGELIGNTLTTELRSGGDAVKLVNIGDYINIDLSITSGTLNWSEGFTYSMFHKSSINNSGNKLLYLSGAYNMGFGSGTEKVFGTVYNNSVGDFTTSLVKPIFDTWESNTYTYNKNTGLSSIYRNGLLEADESGQVSTPYEPNSNNIFIGRASSITNFIGSIDDVRIYNRELTAMEVNLLNKISN